MSWFIIGISILWAEFFKFSQALEVIVVDFKNPYEYIENLPYEIFVPEIFQNFNSSVELHICSFSALKNCILQHPKSLLLLDLSTNLIIQQSISQLCIDFSLFHLVYQSHSKYLEPSTYSLSPSPSSEITAFFSLLSYLNWDQGAVFMDKGKYNQKAEYLNYSAYFDYFTIASLSDIKDLVNGVVVRAGIAFYYFFVNNEISIDLQNSLKNAKLLTNGSGIVLSQESGYGCTIDGAIIITEIGHEYDTSIVDYLKTSIEELIFSILSLEDVRDIKAILDTKMPNHYSPPSYSIVNIQNGNRIIAGSIFNKNLAIFGKLTFLGQSTIIPKSSKKILPISINAGITNPGSADTDAGLQSSWGANICIDKINEGHDILSHFQLQMFNFDCGVTIYDKSYLKSCFTKDIDKLGLAHLAAYGSSVTIGSQLFFKEINITVPSVGSVNGSPLLSSTKDYPMYVRMVSPVAFNVCILFLRAMGWKKAAIIYENGSWGFWTYSLMKTAAESIGIELINPENTRAIPPDLDREATKSYKNLFQGIVNSKARLLIMVLQCPLCNYALESLYDLGLRKGDLYVFAGTWDPLDFISDNDGYAHKRLEIGVSMTRVVYPAWVGEIGKNIYNDYWKKYNITANFDSCSYFDGAYIIATALDYMINRGHDYTDPYQLMSTIRVIKSNGCTGPISIDPGSNDRVFQLYPIQAVKLNSNSTSEVYEVGYLEPYSTQILSITNPLIYPDGSSTKPSDIRNINGKCPFPDREIQTFAKGRGLMFGFCFLVFAITSIITFIIWQKWWNISVEILEEKKEISTDDFIVGATIPIEFFQFVSMGPNFSVFGSILSNLSSMSTIELEDVIKLQNGVFWIITDIVLVCIAIWAVLCVIVLLRLHERWEELWIFRNLGVIAEYLMPVLGNICFMPFISICLDVFLCDKSIGEDFTDSFLVKDCYTFCWKGEHLMYAIISFVAILVYEPLAVFFRPLWQELQQNLHVKAVPGYLMVKSVAQTILIVLAKTLKRSSDISHGVAFVILMMTYIAIISRIKSYNYDRFNLWQFLSLIAVVWLALLSTFYIGFGGNSIVFLAALGAGWLVIALAGFYLQFKKYPSLLYRKKGKNIHGLFKFAFTIRSTIYMIDEDA
ncbi:unnamed protein product [Blepharisma stoltei]|uniref:Receptor ligand binding region domain-containing protein n=1 Tax=Blepharisma stoltei TaxID=1481888 RepID=A0AAU9IVN9_9CILI|nr:unnamed protein product [Blepharisma stoltei]